MRVAIIDDERLARAELRRLLARHPDVTIAGEAANGQQAVDLITGTVPDVILLDIEMPGMSGFDVLERLDDVPPVIFTTAYDAHAVRAFEVSALDYLLKPVDSARLAAALARVPPAGAAPTGRGVLNQVFVRDADRCWIVRMADVFLLESEGNYTRLCFGTERPLIRRSLNAMMARLDPSRYVRASRSQAVNLAFVRSVAATLSGGLIATLRNGQKVEFSRRQSARLRSMLSA